MHNKTFSSLREYKYALYACTCVFLSINTLFVNIACDTIAPPSKKQTQELLTKKRNNIIMFKGI